MANEHLKTSPDGLKIIKDFEGCKLTAYKCPAGVWTIGYGHTRNVKQGVTITQTQADQILKEDVVVFENVIKEYVKVPLNQHQFDALVSWAFNVGKGAVASSTLVKVLNQSGYAQVPAQLKRWNKAGNPLVVMAGLVRRREAEANLWSRAVVVEDSELEEVSTTSSYIKELNLLCRRVYEDNKAKGFWDKERSTAECIALMHSELSEGLNGDRKGLTDDHLPQYSMLEVELADAAIRIMDFCGARGFDLGTIIDAKLAYNRNRPPMHGAKY